MIAHLKVLTGSASFQFMAIDQQNHLLETGVHSYDVGRDSIETIQEWHTSYLTDKDHSLFTTEIYWVHGAYTIAPLADLQLVKSVLQTETIVSEVHPLTSPSAIHFALPHAGAFMDTAWVQKHALAYLLESAYLRESKEPEVCFLVHENKALFVITERGKLQRSSFQIFSNGNDLAYFLLLMLQQESLAQDTPIRICAGISPQSQLDQQLSVFFSNLRYDL
jgi:hypothetical protein